MSESNSLEVGEILRTDLTVSKAEKVRDFYCDVVGWKSMPSPSFISVEQLKAWGNRGRRVKL